MVGAGQVMRIFNQLEGFPSDIDAGEYTLEIGILSPHADVVYFATNAKRNGGFYEVGNIVVK